MKLLALAAALLLAACEPAPPVLDCEANELVGGVEGAAPAGARVAAEYVWAHYGVASPMTAEIRWVEADYFINANGGHEVHGLRCVSSGREMIWVALRSDRPSGTSLAHELTHAALGRLNKDPDSDHAGPEFAALPDLNKALAAEGL